ncbi:hypothetical protein BDQ17DRAFT_1410989 [Cyathus striatus]|nr:hypothetical protein BDQ17DRAFT_1410989 [Cyathus striatus]
MSKTPITYLHRRHRTYNATDTSPTLATLNTALMEDISRSEMARRMLKRSRFSDGGHLKAISVLKDKIRKSEPYERRKTDYVGKTSKTADSTTKLVATAAVSRPFNRSLRSQKLKENKYLNKDAYSGSGALRSCTSITSGRTSSRPPLQSKAISPALYSPLERSRSGSRKVDLFGKSTMDINQPFSNRKYSNERHTASLKKYAYINSSVNFISPSPIAALPDHYSFVADSPVLSPGAYFTRSFFLMSPIISPRVSLEKDPLFDFARCIQGTSTPKKNRELATLDANSRPPSTPIHVKRLPNQDSIHCDGFSSKERLPSQTNNSPVQADEESPHVKQTYNEAIETQSYRQSKKKTASRSDPSIETSVRHVTLEHLETLSRAKNPVSKDVEPEPEPCSLHSNNTTNDNLHYRLPEGLRSAENDKKAVEVGNSFDMTVHAPSSSPDPIDILNSSWWAEERRAMSEDMTRRRRHTWYQVNV